MGIWWICGWSISEKGLQGVSENTSSNSTRVSFRNTKSKSGCYFQLISVSRLPVLLFICCQIGLSLLLIGMDNPYTQGKQKSKTGQRAKKLSWMKRFMSNSTTGSQSPQPSQPQQLGKSLHSSNKGRKTQTVLPHRDGSVSTRETTPKHELYNRRLRISDITSIENDELESFISSNGSTTLIRQEAYQRQFYTRTPNINTNLNTNGNGNGNGNTDTMTVSSIKSIYSSKHHSVYSSANASIASSQKNHTMGSQNLTPIPASPTPTFHSASLYSNHLYPNILYQLNGDGDQDSQSINTYNASMINNVDLKSTSGSMLDDNISTKPILSLSSDDDDDDEEGDEDEEYTDADANFEVDLDPHPGVRGTDTKVGDRSVDADIDNDDFSFIRSTGSAANEPTYLSTPSACDTGVSHIHSSQDILYSNPDRLDDFDGYSMDAKSRYAVSSKSMALTTLSGSVLSPMLQTINSATTMATSVTNHTSHTTQTNYNTAASVLTLASSSRLAHA